MPPRRTASAQVPALQSSSSGASYLQAFYREATAPENRSALKSVAMFGVSESVLWWLLEAGEERGRGKWAKKVRRWAEAMRERRGGEEREVGEEGSGLRRKGGEREREPPRRRVANAPFRTGGCGVLREWVERVLASAGVKSVRRKGGTMGLDMEKGGMICYKSGGLEEMLELSV
ncbi:hypothetical protein MMC13_005110 [Lambiella insularis]|nr:hypothetical protein [Lambiella insularis]